ncbi:unnamed protein product [Cochlearia groenlandica]
MVVGVGNRAEADRWLVTSEKLLASNDFQGAKTFAIRACEADPTRSEAADYILAICDVLIAGDTRLGDSNLPDWYAVLRCGRLVQNHEHVATQYRRLALLLSPSVNRLPFADKAFKVVSDAWYVLSDPYRKSLYDRELQMSQIGESGSNPMERSFWTACPYCYVLFEYPKAYEQCTFKCQDCKRAFEAVTIQKPPVNGEGEDVYFCSWAVFPIGFSGEVKTPSWSPISPLFACPLQKVDEPTMTKRKEPASPRVVYDDDDIYVAISDDDDEEIGASNGKGKESLVRSNKKHAGEKASNPAVSYATAVGSSSGSMSKPMNYATRKRTGTGDKNLGRLDLNVELSNEAEENAVAGRTKEGNRLGNNREVDNMEGIGFFEGLDEFLSSLPILSVGGDDNIKAT